LRRDAFNLGWIFILAHTSFSLRKFMAQRGWLIFQRELVILKRNFLFWEKGIIAMVSKAELFIIMFRAEIENSLEDARVLTDLYEKRFKSEEITNYVYNENEAFLAQETVGLKGLLVFLDSLNPAEFSKAEDVAFEIDDVIKRKVEDYEDPEAIYAIASRKIKKILTYLNMRD
jgi:hypothetical protein